MTKGVDIDPAHVNHDLFWSRVERADGCWRWIGRIDRNGYGSMSVRGKLRGAHRIAWALANSRSPGELYVCHTCDNPICVNPAHLWLGTNEENMADMVAKGRASANGTAGLGDAHPSAKLTEEKVRAIRASTASIHQLAREFGVGSSTINNVRQRHSWRHVA